MADKNKIENALIETMREITRQEIEKINYDYSRKGVIKAVSGNNIDVLFGEDIFTCSFISGLMLQVNDIVLVKFSNLDKINRIIYGKI